LRNKITQDFFSVPNSIFRKLKFDYLAVYLYPLEKFKGSIMSTKEETCSVLQNPIILFSADL
jgi:hypothetical protein